MKLNYKNVIYSSLAFGWITIFWFGYDTLIQTININAFGLNTVYSGLILAIDNILGLFVLPIFGWLSDKCNSKRGKRTPYIIIGTCVSLTGFFFVGIFAGQQKLWFYIIALIVTLFSMAAYRPAALALVPDITPEPLRSRANAVSNLVSALFNIVAIAIVTPFLTDAYIEKNQYMPIVIGIILSSLITMAVFLKKTDEPRFLKTFEEQLVEIEKENRLKLETEAAEMLSVTNAVAENDADVLAENTAADASNSDTLSSEPIEYKEAPNFIEDINRAGEEHLLPKATGLILRNKVFVLLSVFFFYMAYNALVSNFSNYAGLVLNLKFRTMPLIVTMLGALIGFLPSTKFAAKFGRKKTIFWGYVMMLSAFLPLSIGSATNIDTVLPPQFSEIIIYICFALAGTGYGFVMVNIYPLFLELSPSSNVGQGTGIFATAMTTAMIITPILAGYVILKFGQIWDKTYSVTVGNEIVTNFGDFRMLIPYVAANVVLAAVCALLIKEKDWPASRLNKKQKNKI